MPPLPESPRVAIIGGGLAGLAAAAALADAGVRSTVFEARRRLGGRAGSFDDPATGEAVDHCQHVGMGCCTNWLDFCQRAGAADLLRRDRTLVFIGPDGRRSVFRGTRGLPAPLHLATSLVRMNYLSLGERLLAARALQRLARLRRDEVERAGTVGQWLARQRQSPRAIERFWSVVLVSALGESIDRASLVHARKVFVDGFLAHSRAYEVVVPQAPLGEIYERIAANLVSRGVDVRRESPVRKIAIAGSRALGLELTDGAAHTADVVVVAAPWHKVESLFAAADFARLPELHGVRQIEAAPIAGVHLWFDRPVMDAPHAVLVDRLSQWAFSRDDRPGGARAAEARERAAEHYVQVVISASRSLEEMDRSEVVARIVAELAAAFPAARGARLLRSRIVADRQAVFSVRPGFEALRPAQRASVAGLYIAGDWTRTGWPATMESAVRSGRLAAEALLADTGRPLKLLTSDLPRSIVARWLIAT